MGEGDKGHRRAIIVPVVVAVITKIGVLGAAIIPKLIDRWNVDEPEEPKQIVVKDGMPMVLVPAGDYGGLYHDAFYMDKYGVTNAAYKKFVGATNHKH